MSSQSRAEAAAAAAVMVKIEALEEKIEAHGLQFDEVERVLAELRDAIAAIMRRLPGDEEGSDTPAPAKAPKGTGKGDPSAAASR
jgi:hypothetical protein